MIGSDDPRLTAYALDEVDPATAEAVEALLRESASARAALAETQTAAALLSELFAAEAEPALDATQRNSIASAVKHVEPARRPRSLVVWAGLAAALVLALVLANRKPTPRPEAHAAAEPHMAPRIPTIEAPVPEAGSTPAAQVHATPPAASSAPRPSARRTPRPTAIAPMAPAVPPTTVTVHGFVMDPSGAIVPGAAVLVRSVETGAEARTVTSRIGEFKIEGMPPGQLELRAELAGFTPLVNRFSASAGTLPWLPTLQLAGLTDMVMVEAERVEYATASGARLGQTVSPAKAPDTALGRFVTLAGVSKAKAPAAEPRESFNTEGYGLRTDNAMTDVKRNPLSTFALDVDTASYSNVRRFLMGMNQLPPVDAVRIEELVNYFPYGYATPRDGERFAADLEVAPAPWKPERRLLRIGLKTPELDLEHRPPANLVFLLDVSGSMNEPNKLPLVKQSLRLLVERLRADDRVAMAVYAGAAGLVLDSTPGSQKEKILAAIERLEAGGSTNGAAGIQLAYEQAAEHFVEGGINRVILATDGDFNVGLTHQGGLARLIEEKAKSGVFLSVLGFGMGNLKDNTMETLADKGNGNYAYIDTLKEAQKALVEQMASTLVTAAKDVKIQVEFNPARVRAYRLLGYENRLLRAEDFKDDTKDAGEVGAGHTVTALYELVPAKGAWKAPKVDPLRYQSSGELTDAAQGGELLRLKLRYKEPDGHESQPLEWTLVDRDTELGDTSPDFRFAAAVAEFGMLLRNAPDKGRATFTGVLELADAARGNDPGGHRAEFVELVKRAAALKAR